MSETLEFTCQSCGHTIVLDWFVYQLLYAGKTRCLVCRETKEDNK